MPSTPSRIWTSSVQLLADDREADARALAAVVATHADVAVGLEDAAQVGGDLVVRRGPEPVGHAHLGAARQQVPALDEVAEAPRRRGGCAEPHLLACRRRGPCGAPRGRRRRGSARPSRTPRRWRPGTRSSASGWCRGRTGRRSRLPAASRRARPRQTSTRSTSRRARRTSDSSRRRADRDADAVGDLRAVRVQVHPHARPRARSTRSHCGCRATLARPP